MKFIICFVLISFSYSAFSQNEFQKYYKQARNYDTLGNIDNAVDYYTKAIEENPTFQYTYIYRGSIFAKQQKFGEALNDYKTAKKLAFNDTVDYELQYLIAGCYMYIGPIDSALKYINQSLKEKPNYLKALKYRASLLLSMNYFTKALDDLNKASTLTQDDYDIYYLKGFCYQGMNDTINALHNYRKAESLGYTSYIIFDNIGSLYVDLGDYNNALIYFAKSLALKNDYALAYYNQGFAYDKMGFRESALNSWKKAKEFGFTKFSPDVQKILDKN